MKTGTPKHTPGPWTITVHHGYGERQRYTIDQEPITPRMLLGEDANARLIAAAPDLLAACHAFVDTFTDNDETTSREYDAYEAAGAAIAKAEGE